jgi:serine/threonine protein phosphatase PrpC
MIKNKIFNNVINFCSIQNKRPYNEDELYLNTIKYDKDINLYCVFDGHGGKFVSKFLLNNIPKYILNNDINYEVDNNKIINDKIKNYFEYIQCDLEN